MDESDPSSPWTHTYRVLLWREANLLYYCVGSPLNAEVVWTNRVTEKPVPPTSLVKFSHWTGLKLRISRQRRLTKWSAMSIPPAKERSPACSHSSEVSQVFRETKSLYITCSGRHVLGKNNFGSKRSCEIEGIRYGPYFSYFEGTVV